MRLPPTAGVSFVLVAAVLAVVAAAPVLASLTPHGTADDPDGNVTVLRGDGRLAADVDGPFDLRGARRDGRLEPAGHVVPGDLLVLRFRSPRIGERFVSTQGNDSTDRFLHLLNTTATDASVERRRHTQSFPAAEFGLDRGNLDVYHDPSNATFWLLVDTDDVGLIVRDGTARVFTDLAFSRYQAVVEVPTAGGATRVVAGSFDVEPRRASLAGADSEIDFDVFPATVRKAATSAISINGSSTLLSGSNLTVRVVGSDGTTLATRRVRTRDFRTTDIETPDSVFNATLPIGLRHSGDVFDVVVSHEGERIHERRVVVGRAARMWNGDAELLEEREHAGMIAVSATLRLPAEGFFSVYVEEGRVSTTIPEGETVSTTLYVNRSALWDDGSVHAYAIWDRDGDGVLEEDPDRLFETSLEAGAASDDGELDIAIPVDGRVTATPSPTPSPTITRSPPPESRSPTATSESPNPTGTPRPPPPTSSRAPGTRSIGTPSFTPAPSSASGTGSTPSGVGSTAGKTTPSTPGFGPVIAVAAIAVAVALRHRRPI